jgi:hypothetical protein
VAVSLVQKPRKARENDCNRHSVGVRPPSVGSRRAQWPDPRSATIM